MAAPTGLDPGLRRAVESALAERDGFHPEIVASHGVAGGCIHDSRRIDLADGRTLFLKADRVGDGEAHGQQADLFEREAEGLAALAAAAPGAETGHALRIPSDPLPGRAADLVFLVMEHIPTGSPSAGFWEDFGRGFAALHRATAVEPNAALDRTGAANTPERRAAFGFPHANYLGGTPQPNPWSNDWTAFMRDHRLGHQLHLARSRGHTTPELERLTERLLDRLEDILDLPDEPGCLLHGDLWSGNFLTDDHGRPVLVDPAAYHGHREADLAMTRLFGGFDRRFYAAYQEAWPLPAGSQPRQDVYQLYHLMNHLNLFGPGYLSQCLAVLRRLV